MAKPTIEVNQDHLLVRFRGLDAAAALTRTIQVPYSTIVSADVREPVWPSWGKTWGYGMRMPGVVLKGAIGKPLGPYDHFYWMTRGTDRVLRLGLAGHPRFREIHLDLDDAQGVLQRIEDRRRGKA